LSKGKKPETIKAMEPIRLPNEKEINAAYEEGKEAVLKLFQDTFVVLAERIQKLEDQLAKNSQNSGKPPSSDGLDKPAPHSLRKRGRRSSGGQAGHAGHKLELVEKPDHIKKYKVANCAHCRKSLKREKVQRLEKRQVFDLPQVRMEVTEHQVQIKRCSGCGKETRAEFPKEVNQTVQYGTEAKAQMAYLNHEHYIPLKRTCDVFEEFYGHRPAEGTVYAAGAAAARLVAPVTKSIKEHLTLHEAVIGNDETGLRIDGKLYWLHTTGTASLTYYAYHQKRGKVAMDAINILPRFQGRVVHDDLPSYFQYDFLHAVCNAHHLRVLLFLQERYPQKWVEPLIALLLKIKKKVETAQRNNQSELSDRQKTTYFAHYDTLIQQGLRANPPPSATDRKAGQRGRLKQSPARNLLVRLKEHRLAVLAFMVDFKVPFDNNQSERDLRMMKVKQKISGCFRSEEGAEIFCQIRGYLSTARKNGQMALHSLRLAFMGNPFLPSFVAPLG
jgi:transposase